MGNIARPVKILWEEWYMTDLKFTCAWCLQRDATFELVIYHLRKQRSVVAPEKREMIIRGDKYLTVKLCKQCLPATTLYDFAKEQHEESERRRKEKHL